MDADGCTSHININACLPPRKRLLAGMKKQSCENTSFLSSHSSDYGAHLCEFLGIDSKKPHISPEEIVEASKSAALATAKFAAAAKATALEKAAVAAKAAAAAKSALELVASVSRSSTRVETCLRRNKPRRHVPLKLFYKGHPLTENQESDEELARRLHRAMNSSPRISKNSVNSNWKNRGLKIHEKLPSPGKAMLFKEAIVCEGSSSSSICDKDDEVDDSAADILEGGTSDKLDEQVKLCTPETDCSDVADSLHVREVGKKYSVKKMKKHHCALEARSMIGGKRAKTKHKNLPLSLCSMRDCERPKEKTKPEGFTSTEEIHAVRTMPSSSEQPKEAASRLSLYQIGIAHAKI